MLPAQLQRGATGHDDRDERTRRQDLSQAGRVDLRWMLQELRYDFKVKYVACEGGPALFRSLLEQGLVDQLNLTIAPFLFGGKDAPTLIGTGMNFLPRSVRCSLKEMKIVGDECFLIYRIQNKL